MSYDISYDNVCEFGPRTAVYCILTLEIPEGIVAQLAQLRRLG